jgi:hypothetical protein
MGETEPVLGVPGRAHSRSISRWISADFYRRTDIGGKRRTSWKDDPMRLRKTIIASMAAALALGPGLLGLAQGDASTRPPTASPSALRGFYDTADECEYAGIEGEVNGEWSSFRCSKVSFWWALYA